MNAIVLEAEFFEIQAKEVQNGGVKMVKRMDVFDGLLPEIIGDAMTDPGLHTRTGHPAGEAIRIVIATFGTFLEEGHAAKLGAPDD